MAWRDPHSLSPPLQEHRRNVSTPPTTARPQRNAPHRNRWGAEIGDCFSAGDDERRTLLASGKTGPWDGASIRRALTEEVIEDAIHEGRHRDSASLAFSKPGLELVQAPDIPVLNERLVETEACHGRLQKDSSIPWSSSLSP